MSLCDQWTLVDHLQRCRQPTWGRLTNLPEYLLPSWSKRSYQTSEYHCHRAGSKENNRRRPLLVLLKLVQHTPSFIHRQTLDGLRYDTTIPDLWMCLSPWTKSHPNRLTDPSGHPLSCWIIDCREPPNTYKEKTIYRAVTGGIRNLTLMVHIAPFQFYLNNNPWLQSTWTQAVSHSCAIFTK